jgi:putative Mn2+ efflux pump MntP
MNTFLTTFVIGISLSMDAFSLALIYGMEPLTKKNKIALSLTVGLFHFVMPLIGIFFGSLIIDYLPFNVNILVSIIFSLIGIDMIYSSIKNKTEPLSISIIGFLLFGLSVSIDSFTTGIGMNIINNNYLQVSTTFAILSALFTYTGLVLGNKINKSFGPTSSLVGGTILLILAIYYYTI